MKKVLVVSLLVTALISSLGVLAVGGTTSAPTLTYEVTAINEISVSGTPSLTVSAAVAGVEPTAVTDADSTYCVTTNTTAAQKITVSLNSNMTTDLTLKVKMATSIGATNASTYVDISNTATTPADVLTGGINKEVETDAIITYELTALVSAGVISSAQKTVTFTLTDA